MQFSINKIYKKNFLLQHQNFFYKILEDKIFFHKSIGEHFYSKKSSQEDILIYFLSLRIL